MKRRVQELLESDSTGARQLSIVFPLESKFEYHIYIYNIYIYSTDMKLRKVYSYIYIVILCYIKNLFNNYLRYIFKVNQIQKNNSIIKLTTFVYKVKIHIKEI